ncbi:MAG: hypothetical protein KC486_36380, partial [Myxococcales bacterium]|nr:hypothetical protein [Myxococcales bacterium]
TDPDARAGDSLKLVPLGDAGRDEVLRLLDRALASPRLRDVPEGIRERLAAAAPRDVAELTGALGQLAKTTAERAEAKLTERGAGEAEAMKAILKRQRKRLKEKLADPKAEKQLTLGFNEDEQRQRAADLRRWERRLEALKDELKSEPKRIIDGYRVKAVRSDPVGVVYLWPVSS